MDSLIFGNLFLHPWGESRNGKETGLHDGIDTPTMPVSGQLYKRQSRKAHVLLMSWR
jgi:hypothetical protein